MFVFQLFGIFSTKVDSIIEEFSCNTFLCVCALTLIHGIFFTWVVCLLFHGFLYNTATYVIVDTLNLFIIVSFFLLQYVRGSNFMEDSFFLHGIRDFLLDFDGKVIFS